LENKRAEQVLPGSEGEVGRKVGREEGGGEQGGEVAQAMFTHMNKCKNNKKVLIRQIQQHIKRIVHCDQMDASLRFKDNSI
jgi:hypothetical protein